MIESISKNDRLIGVLHRVLLKKIPNEQRSIQRKVDQFLEKYCTYAHFSSSEVASIVNRFQLRYSEDMKVFSDTGKYPHELNVEEFQLSREEYDVVLICSILTAKHRHKIISMIDAVELKGQSVAVIGVGSGVELLFINTHGENIDAYDLSISKFAKFFFGKVNFHEKKFEFSKNRYDTIFAIEILEHLENPIALLKDIYCSLNDKGKCIFTVTTNVPQFDHLYDFNIKNFVIELKLMGFEILECTTILHDLNFNKIKASNTFFIVRKA
jgi:hypothetical protein